MESSGIQYPFTWFALSKSLHKQKPAIEITQQGIVDRTGWFNNFGLILWRDIEELKLTPGLIRCSLELELKNFPVYFNDLNIIQRFLHRDSKNQQFGKIRISLSKVRCRESDLVQNVLKFRHQYLKNSSKIFIQN